MAELAPPLATFLRDYLPRDRGTSRHTVESYAPCFKLLVVFAADKHGIRPCTLEIGHLNIATLLEFLEHLERESQKRGAYTQCPARGHQGLVPLPRVPAPEVSRPRRAGA